MAVGKPASPSKLPPNRRRRANYCCWSLTLLLVLTHSWNTLQCSTSSSQPQIINKPPRDYDSSNSKTLEEVGETPYFSRNTRGEVQETIRACSHRLRNVLDKLCGGNFYDPSAPITEYESIGADKLNHRTPLRKRTVIFVRRLPRSVVNECCIEACSDNTMKKYCRNGVKAVSQEQQPIPDSTIPEEVEEMDSSSTQLIDQPVALVTQAQPDSAFTYTLLHIMKFLQNMHTPKPKAKPNSVEPSSPLARVQNQFGEPSNPTTGVGGGADSEFDGGRQQPYSTNSNLNSALASANRGNGRGHGHHHRNRYLNNEGSQTNLFPIRRLQVDDEEARFQSQPQWFEDENGEFGMHEHRQGTALNAVTSTLPPKLIPLGPQTNDYIIQPMN